MSVPTLEEASAAILSGAATFLPADCQVLASRAFAATRVHSAGVVFVVCDRGRILACSMLGTPGKPSWLGRPAQTAEECMAATERDFAKPEAGRRWVGEWNQVA